MASDSKVEGFKNVAVRWHRLLGLNLDDSIESRQAKVARNRMYDANREDRLVRLACADLRGSLRTMIGKEDAHFRGLQEEALKHIQLGASRVVVVGPTAMGKSFLFMLPAFCSPDGISVVIVPLLALQNDLADRCVAAGIDTYVYKSVPRTAALILTTPEAFLSKTFLRWLTIQRSILKVDRIFLGRTAHLHYGHPTAHPTRAVLRGSQSTPRPGRMVSDVHQPTGAPLPRSGRRQPANRRRR
jgi:hypothetical protein